MIQKVSKIALMVLAVGLLAMQSAPLASADGFPIEITEFTGEATTPEGEPLTQAGAHPDFTTSFKFASVKNKTGVGGEFVPKASVKSVSVGLPPGLVGNPSATPKCGEAQFDVLSPFPYGGCPGDTQVGWVTIYSPIFSGPGNTTFAPLYNLAPSGDEPALFAFRVIDTVGKIVPTLRSDGDYGLTATSEGISQTGEILGITVTFWGVPANPVHNSQRLDGANGLFGGPSGAPELAFMSSPTNCAAGPLTVAMSANSWQVPSVFDHASFLSHLPNGEPTGVTGCDALSFEPTLDAQPTVKSADSPSGMEVKLAMPQPTNPESLAPAQLKRAEVVLPAGVSINPSSAAGLAGCSQAQMHEEGTKAQPGKGCPDSSKIGTVKVDTPLLEKPLEGSVFLAQPHDNQFDSLLAIYLVARGSGVVVRLPGHVSTDPSSGQITATFDQNPQLPFELLTVRFNDGPTAPLITPSTCGTYNTVARMSSWSAADPEHPMPSEVVTSTSSFQITSGANGGPCPNGGFEPKLSAGTTNPVAGAFSPFQLAISRPDGSQLVSTVTASLPEGLLGKLAGVPYCPDAALAAVPTGEGTGAGQLASPSCAMASQIGTVTVGAGAGSNPFYVNTGRVYLAGPYKGAPLSMAFVTPAIAGPFDLGNVVVRAALRIDPETARITAVSDPLPTILHGIPLDLRDVRISIDRDGFTLNPTSCNASSIGTTITAAGGASASPSSRFQVTDCERLEFKPKLDLSVKGSTTRSGHPAFKAVLTAPSGQANIGRAAVSLPPTEFLENAHIRTICTRVQYAADACPAASIYGHAIAWTPLLDKPLEGPVYLRSSNHKLPDLVASLDGQIHIDLDGRIDSVHRRIRTTFEAVPDAPVSKFVLEMQGGKKGLLVNNTELCGTTSHGTAVFTAHNGKQVTLHPLMKAGCGGRKRR